MTETTTTKTDTIADLEAAVREASRHSRSLALELDAIPNKLEEAIKQDVSRKAAAARAGAAVAAVDEASEVPQLRQRMKDLPYEIWAAQVHHSALEIESFARQQEDFEQKARQERSGLEGLKMDMDEATRKYHDKANVVEGFEGGASRLSYARVQAERRLKSLEQEHRGV